MYHTNVNVNFMVEKVEIQIKSGIKINADTNGKNFI